MSSPRSFASRIARILAVGAIALAATPQLSTSAQFFETAFDLPAALLAPDDVAEVGFEDYGIWAGWSVNAEERIRELENSGWDEFEARSEVEEYGTRVTYYQSLLPIDEQSAGVTEPTITIQTILEEFDSASAAEAGYELAKENPGYEGAEFIDDAPSYGDESVVLRFDLEPGTDGIEYPVQVTNVVFCIEWGSNQYTETEAVDTDELGNLADEIAAFTFATEGETTHARTNGEIDEFAGMKLLVQVDEIVYEIDLFGVDAPELETLEAMADELIDCAAGGCTDYVGFPGDVEDYLTEQAELTA